MGALDQACGGTAIASIEAGVDLLLAGPAHARAAAEMAAISAGLAGGFRRDGPGGAEVGRRERVLELRLRSVGPQPPLDVVGSTEHRELAAELARAR